MEDGFFQIWSHMITLSVNNNEWLQLELIKDKGYHGTVYNLNTLLQLQTLQGKVTQGYSSMLAYVTIL